MKLNLFVYFIVILWIDSNNCFFIIGNSNYDFIVNEVECLEPNSFMCADQICELKISTKKHLATLNIGCSLGLPLHDFYISVKLYYDYQRYHMTLISIDHLNFCEYMRLKIVSQILKEVLPMLEDYVTTKNIHACPYLGPVSLENFPVQTGSLSPKVPAGNYTLNIRIYDQMNQTIIYPQLKGSLKLKRAQNILRGKR